MAEKVVFETNLAVSVALKFADGKRLESRYYEYEVLYSLTDGRVLYATPALAEKITALAPAIGEVFTICKAEIRDGQRKRIEWQVTAAAAEERPREPAQASPSRPGPRPVPAKAPEPVSAPATMTQIMGGALIAAIDSLASAAEYAREKHNWELLFGAEDVRAAANSIVIQFFRDRETRARYPQTAPQQRVNGGTQWQQ